MGNEPNPKTGEGGAGGGGGDETPFNEAQLKHLEGIITKSVGGAVATHLTRGKTKESLQEMMQGIVIGALKEWKPPAVEPPEGTNPNPNPGAKGGEPSDEVKALMRKLDALGKENQKLSEAFKAKDEAETKEREKARRTKERASLHETLIDLGVHAAQARAAASMLHNDTQRVKTSEDGAVLFTDGDGEDVALKDGLAAWLKTDDGKAFLPPVDGSGSGNPGGRRQVGGKQEPTMAERMIRLGQGLSGPVRR